MKNEKETKEKLLESAKQEFMEKGYTGASLRNICKKAGVTTGALYFFFEDKEDLFGALVKEPLERLAGIMKEHYLAEVEVEDQKAGLEDDFSDDIKASKAVVHFMFQYYDEFLLLLMKSQGSAYANCVNEFADITSRHYRQLADEISRQTGTAPVADGVIHWIAHMHMDIFVYLLEHMESEEQALRYIDGILTYTVGGWRSLFR